jgi:hypothetical protein
MAEAYMCRRSAVMDREAEGRRVRRAMVGGVLKGMHQTDFEIPEQTMTVFLRWIEEDSSVSLEEIEAVLRPFHAWMSGRDG